MTAMIHDNEHPLVDQTVTIKTGTYKGQEYRIEDWWDRVIGKSWMVCQGNPACIGYAIRGGMEGLPTDDEVLYGKIGVLGYLIHESEL